MQRAARQDELCQLAEDHEIVVAEAIDDGIITPAERALIIRSARRLKLAVGVQACRTRLGIRMIRGGGIDGHIYIELADYLRLAQAEIEEATISQERLAA